MILLFLSILSYIEKYVVIARNTRRKVPLLSDPALHLGRFQPIRGPQDIEKGVCMVAPYVI